MDSSGSIVGGVTYVLNDFEEATATQLYIGKESKEGAYLIISADLTSGVALRYATISNNALVTTYAAAWTARATLTYETYAEAFA